MSSLRVLRVALAVYCLFFASGVVLSCLQPNNNSSYNGQTTHCIITNNVVHICKEDDLSFLEAAFVNDSTSPVYRENMTIPGCESISGTSDEELPQWVFSCDSDQIDSLLQSHCFWKPYVLMNGAVCKHLFQITGFSSVQDRRISDEGYIIPESSNVLAYGSLEEAVASCTYCSRISFLRGQSGLASFTRLVDLIRHASSGSNAVFA